MEPRILKCLLAVTVEQTVDERLRLVWMFRVLDHGHPVRHHEGLISTPAARWP